MPLLDQPSNTSVELRSNATCWTKKRARCEMTGNLWNTRGPHSPLSGRFFLLCLSVAFQVPGVCTIICGSLYRVPARARGAGIRPASPSLRTRDLCNPHPALEHCTWQGNVPNTTVLPRPRSLVVRKGVRRTDTIDLSPRKKKSNFAVFGVKAA